MGENLNADDGEKPALSGKNTSAEGTEINSMERKTEIDNLIAEIRTELKDVLNKNTNQILISLLVCLISLFFAIYLGGLLYNYDEFPENWTWQIIYLSVIRITIITAVFTFTGYCFKLLSSYLHYYQRNRHRLMVINSMAGLISSAPSKIDLSEIYKILFEIVVNFDSGIIRKNLDKSNKTDSSLVDLCKKLIEKNK